MVPILRCLQGRRHAGGATPNNTNDHSLTPFHILSIILHIPCRYKKNFFAPDKIYDILIAVWVLSGFAGEKPDKSAGDSMDRSNIEKIAQTSEDKLLLAKLWDKINAGMRRSIPGNTGFLSPREQELARYLFGQPEGLYFFGGYEDAERKMLIYLPEYLEEDSLWGPDSPCVCLRATFFQGDSLSHRDFLGALMGAGIARETLGDICVGEGCCDFFVTADIAPYILSSFTSAGRTKLHLEQIPLAEADLPEPEIKEIRDTLASLRLDSVIASGFRIGRSLAGQYISAGKAAIDGLPCEKPDKAVTEGMKISVRGLGKLRLAAVGGKTKKDRISVVIHRYV